MSKQIKINEKKLLQKKQFLDSIGPQSWSDYEAYARCLFYLGEKEKAKAYFLEAAGRIANLLSVFEKRNQTEFARIKMVQANFYRLAGDNTESLKQYEEIQGLLLHLFKTEYEENVDKGNSLLSKLSTCYFFLEDYEKSVHYGSMVKEWQPIAQGYSEGILHKNNKQIQSTLDHVIKEINHEKSVPYDTGAEISLWDWYEIGKELALKFSAVE
ncbi:hypothetical protein [uncultured Metabacillus sp.]|uniref:hypothetical protein n=1 Tax=uncultured Metabacillus sp. TaxID=2860135 RepID=UPI002632B576|nr:hypothetical protein [uncultured Metabacillus sp.]